MTGERQNYEIESLNGENMSSISPENINIYLAKTQIKIKMCQYNTRSEIWRIPNFKFAIMNYIKFLNVKEHFFSNLSVIN